MSNKDALLVGAVVTVFAVICGISWLLSMVSEQVVQCCERALSPASELDVTLKREIDATHNVTVDLKHDAIQEILDSVRSLLNDHYGFSNSTPGFRSFFADVNAVRAAANQVERINITIQSAEKLQKFHSNFRTLFTRTSNLFNHILPELDNILRVRNAVSDACTHVAAEQDVFLQATNTTLRALKRSIQLFFPEVTDLPNLERILWTTVHKQITNGLDHEPTEEENTVLEMLPTLSE